MSVSESLGLSAEDSFLWSHGGGEDSPFRSDSVTDGSGRTEALNASFGSLAQHGDYLNNGFWAYLNYQGTAPRHWGVGATVTVNITALNAADQVLAQGRIGEGGEELRVRLGDEQRELAVLRAQAPQRLRVALREHRREPLERLVPPVVGRARTESLTLNSAAI